MLQTQSSPKSTEVEKV